MAGPAFDPNGAVKFDLRSGAAADARGHRLVLVPSAALSALERAHPDALVHLGAAIGKEAGARIAARLGGTDAVRAAGLELVLTHLAGEIAIAGVGSLRLERWGRAMVIVLASTAVESDAFSGAVIAAAFGAATGREVATAVLGRDGSEVRLFVGSRATAEGVESRIQKGEPYGDVLASLQGGAS